MFARGGDRLSGEPSHATGVLFCMLKYAVQSWVELMKQKKTRKHIKKKTMKKPRGVRKRRRQAVRAAFSRNCGGLRMLRCPVQCWRELMKQIKVRKKQ